MRRGDQVSLQRKPLMAVKSEPVIGAKLDLRPYSPAVACAKMEQWSADLTGSHTGKTPSDLPDPGRAA
jgi:hypothetical protein